MGYTIAVVALLGIHVFHALVQGNGGWRGEHGGLSGAILAFFRLSFRDPVLSAGLSDFAAVAGVLGFWMYADLPPQDRRRPRTFAWLALYTLFPGLGALLYPLWIHPGHRLATGRTSV
jgi:hypothetical protein